MNTAYSMVSGQVAAVAKGQLRSLSTAGMALDPAFLSVLTAIRDTTGNAQRANLRDLYDNYGTHYVR